MNWTGDSTESKQCQQMWEDRRQDGENWENYNINAAAWYHAKQAYWPTRNLESIKK